MWQKHPSETESNAAWTQTAAAIILTATRWSSSRPEKQGSGQEEGGGFALGGVGDLQKKGEEGRGRGTSGHPLPLPNPVALGLPHEAGLEIPFLR